MPDRGFGIQPLWAVLCAVLLTACLSTPQPERHESADQRPAPAMEEDSFLLLPPFYYHRKKIFEEDLFVFLSGKKIRGARRDYYGLFPLARYTNFEGSDDQCEAYLFPLLDYKRDGGRRRLKTVDLSAILGLFTLLDVEWGVPPEEGLTDPGHSYAFFNVLNMIRLAGGGNAGGYNDLELFTFFSSENLSLYQYHWRKQGPERGHTVLFPFYWRFKDEEGEALHLWPLYGWERSTDGMAKDHLLYPFFSLIRDESRARWAVDVPWPLVRIMRGENGDYETRLMPLYCRYDTEETDLLAVTPLFWHYRDHQEQFAFDLLFPLYAHFGRGGDDNTYSLVPIFKLIWGRPKHEQPGRTQYDLLWPLANYGRLDQRRVGWLFPLFSFEQDTDLERWRFLLNFFGFETKGARKTFTLFWFIPISWGDEDESPSKEEES